MLEIDRFDKILFELNKKGRVSYQELEKIMSVSSSTIRRDIKKMQTKGLLIEIKGGISKITKNKQDIETEDRFKENIISKKEISLNALKVIKDGDFIYLDAGTTTFYLIEKLKGKNITVVTNGLMHIDELIKNNIKTILIGGEVKGTTKAIIGTEAMENLEKFRFDKCFIGTNGINIESGYTTPELNEAVMKKKVINLSDESYILADETKFNKNSNIKFSEIDKCKIITTKKAIKDNNRYKRFILSNE